MSKKQLLALVPSLVLAGSALPEEKQSCSSMNYEASLSYLFWNAREDALNFAAKNRVFFQGQTPSVEPLIGHIKSPKGRWDSGFRVGSSFSDHTEKFGHYGLRAEWTYFHSTSSSRATTAPDATLGVIVSSLSLFAPQSVPFPFANSARAKWTLQINEFALNLEYFCHATSRILLRPYIGLFGANIEQNRQAHYLTVTRDFGNTVISRLTLRTKNDFWGVGPSFGAGVSWNLWKHLALIGNAFTSGLYGRFHTKNSVKLSDPITFPFTNFKSNPTRLRPMIGALLGLECGGNVSACARLSLSASYEFQYWWQQWHDIGNQVGNAISGTGHWGDLSLQGFVFTAKAEF